MPTFTEMINDRKMAGMLVTMRLKLAARRHKAHFFRNFSADAAEPGRLTSQLDTLLPPRRTWARAGRLVRTGLSPDELDRRSLLNAILNGFKQGAPITAWASELRLLFDGVRQRAACPRETALRAPVIRVLSKSGNRKSKAEPVKYRVVAAYEDLSDRLLLGLGAKYLAEALDPLFLDCSCAFRVSRDCSRGVAVKRIQDYVVSRNGGPVYVAECDIQNFYDTVDHDVAWAAFSRASRTLEDRGQPVPPQILDIMEMYLGSYDYYGVGEPAALAELRKKTGSATLGSPVGDALRALRGTSEMGRVGIPQGGPLSPLLANLVLDAADRAVVGDGFDPDLLYLRYCDDMIILHKDQSKCEAALARYIGKVKELLFLVHPPSPLTTYGKEFHEQKSKLPFRLGTSATLDGVSPWLSFLGYQVRHDGQLRVKRESLMRHKGKQKEVVMRVMGLVRRPRARLREKNEEILGKVAFRLVAAAIGKKPGTPLRKDVRCWMEAFHLLKRNPYAERQMRNLDQYRDGLLARLGHALHISHPDNHAVFPGDEKKQEQIRWKMPHLGRSRSYCGRLIGDVQAGPGRWRDGDQGYGAEY